MAVNIEYEFKKIADDLTKLVQDELRRQKLIETGKLINSVKFIVTKTPTGYMISLDAVDYFKFVNEKYKVTENVFRSVAYTNIQERIKNLYSLVITEELNEN